MRTPGIAQQRWQQLRYLMDSLPGAMLGAAFYGAWAVWANWSAGPAMAWRAGLGHWLVSTLLTYFGTALMRRFFAIGAQPLEGAVLAASGGLAVTYGALLTVHLSIGTPHLLLTLAAGVLPNLLFCTGYASLLMRTATGPREPARAAAPPLGAHHV